jgi:hypothetical protein
MSKDWQVSANSIGMSLEILHRVASMTSGGCDTLPHNGAVITLLAVCGLTRRQSYPDIGMITLIKTMAVFSVILLYHATDFTDPGNRPLQYQTGQPFPGREMQRSPGMGNRVFPGIG